MLSKEIAQSWIDEAGADHRLKGIIAEVEQTYELAIGIGSGPSWESSIVNGKAIIRMAETDRPMASFAHEILHLRLSARGYRHILGCAHPDEKLRGVVLDLLDALDNELQHRRTFPEFLSAGFSGDEFYSDDDDADWVDVETHVRALSGNETPSIVLFIYLSLIAPGGGWPQGKLEEITDLLQAKIKPETWSRLLAVKAAIEAWARDDTMDPTETIVSIFEALGDLGGTFIAEDVGTYPTGAFIPRSMTQDQFEDLAKQAAGVAP